MNETMTSPGIRHLFSALPGRLAMLGPDLTIIAVSGEYGASKAFVGTMIPDKDGLRDALHKLVIDKKITVLEMPASGSGKKCITLSPVLDDAGDVSAIIYKEEELKPEAGTIARLNKELETFSYSVSHDLRAPLRAVLGFSRMLEEDYGKTLDDGGRRLLDKVSSNAARMGELIDGLLVYSRVGRRTMTPGNVDMNVLVDSVLKDINRDTDNNADVIIGDLRPVVADAALMTQVVNCLLDNAIKFSAGTPRPLVEIQSAVLDNEVVFSVKDNGVGFNPRYADKLFGVFQRLHTAEEFDGVGVGLAVTARIIARHGGRVWIESAPGEGAKVFFSLPLAKT